MLTYARSGATHCPPRRPPSWSQMLARFAETCTAHGIQRGRLLPLHGLDDAELTFSAIQALDPYLKRGQHHVHAHGFLPQPVVRFTGPRDASGTLLPGFATSFVNVSLVEPIATMRDHAALIDVWISALARIGFHAQHLTITGNLNIWNRTPVAGITLKIHHCGRELGDAVLLWNQNEPAKLASDIGSGLERLAWILTGESWEQAVYGTLGEQVDVRVLDAVRTATLVVASGVSLATRGPGSATRRMLRAEAKRVATLGLSRIVRWAHDYWSRVQPLPLPWPEVCRILEAEVFDEP